MEKLLVMKLTASQKSLNTVSSASSQHTAVSQIILISCTLCHTCVNDKHRLKEKKNISYFRSSITVVEIYCITGGTEI